MTQSDPSQTILIVDDQEQNLQVVGTLLTAMGYTVSPATSGRQALERLRSFQPDLILLDMVMPDMDGLQVCREILSHPEWKEIPVIFLSAAGDKDLIVRALEAGGVDYVTKPFNKAELLSRVRTHLALKEARDHLRVLAEDKDELLGILAHDLKNHLAGMRLSAGLLAERSSELAPRSAALVENIVQSTDRMIAFVREFLANQSAERLHIEPRSLPLVDEIRAAANRLREAAAVKSIEIKMVGEASPVVLADGEALAQVLDNLIGNAVKFSPSGSTVTITIPEPGFRNATFTVSDQGPGFTQADRGKLFRRYGRLSARPTGGEPSTGLGLSIVKRLVDSMGGRIDLEANDLPGAHFQVRLPLPLPLAEA